MTATLTITDKPRRPGDVICQLSFSREGKPIEALERSAAIQLAAKALGWITEQREAGTRIRGFRCSAGKEKSSKKRKGAA